MDISSENNKIENNYNENIITFIIPTIGRPTLERSVQSIINQTNKKWEIIIVFDGIDPTYKTDNKKIRVLKLDKKVGTGINSAGNVRNYGMQFVNTKWIGFLDDDDVLSPFYIKKFISEKKKLNNQKLDVVIFRMYSEHDRTIFPLLDQTNFFINNVGISFAFKTRLFYEGNKFIPSSAEDYYFLDKLRQNNYKMMISPFIMYFVRPDSIEISDNISSQNGKRGIINTNL